MAAADCQWYYTRSGVTYGPFPLQVLRDLVECRFLGATSYVWNSAQGGDWKMVSTCPEFAGALSAEAGEAPPKARPEWQAVAEMLSARPVKAEERPRMRPVVTASWRWMVLSLFRPFRFLQWAGIAFCSWMAATRSLVGVFDEETLLSELQGGAPVVTSVFLSARQWAVGVLSGHSVFFWGAMVFFYLVTACFLRAKGRLMFLHRLRFPGDSIQAAWTETTGRTLPLALFHFVIDLLAVSVEIFVALRVFSSLGEGTIRSGSLATIVQAISADVPSRRCLFLLGGALLAISLVRSLAYHFIEPVFYRLHLSFRDACGLFGHLAGTQFPALCSFYLHVLLFRSCVLSVGVFLGLLVMLVGAPFFAFLPLLLPYFIRLAFLPADYFIRSLGPRFLAAWKGLW